MQHSLNNLLDKAAQGKTTQVSAITSLNSTQKKTLALTWSVLFNRKLVSDPVGSTAYRQFESDMADLSDRQIEIGLERAKDFTGFFTTPTFRELCRVTPEDIGLPAVHAAYLEAAKADGPRDMLRWSHPAVYHAGRETGWFELRTGTEKEIYPLFKRNYEEICRRVMGGEQLDMPVQRALPSKVFVPASPEKARATLNSIKELLG